MTKVGFVGAGQLGVPMVERLASAGCRLVVHARRAEVRDIVSATGATTTDDLAAVGRDADVVIVCVFDDDQLREVSGPLLASMRPGSVLASHVTGMPSVVREIAAVAAERCIHVVDAPVSGTANDIRVGQLTVLLGGPDEACTAVSEVMSAYARPVILTGDVGSALGVKLVNNMLFVTNLQLLAAAADLARELGSDEATLLKVLQTSSGGSYASRAVEARQGVDALAGQVARFLRKDAAACAAQLAELGLDGGLLSHVAARGRLDFGSEAS